MDGLSDEERDVQLVTEGEIIKRKKEKKRQKKEKLLKQLEERRKRENEEQEDSSAAKKLKSVFDSQKPSAGRQYTVSVALAGSILDNAQSPELRTYLAGQIARALAVFNVDEVVIFDDEQREDEAERSKKTTEGVFQGIGKHGQSCVQLARILQYLECPQYLRKHFFPIHKDLKYAGVLNPTDMPHHLRATEKSQYREGVVIDRPPHKNGSLANVGLAKDVILDKVINPGVRVTVKLDPETSLEVNNHKIFGKVVSPSAPRTEQGLYWGYQLRLADSLSGVLTKSPYKGGYDLTLGTSERGTSVDEFEFDGENKFKHLLIVLGGVKGLEQALEVDDKLDGADPEPLFDHYLNTCPSQGSRTIRTEEALLVTLSALRPKILKGQSK